MSRTKRVRGCNEYQGLSRRGFLQVGALGALGLTMGDMFRMQEARANMATGGDAGASAEAAAAAATAASSKAPAAESVIQIFLPGGLSAQESFDPKPDAPLEYRGPFDTIPTAITGERFSRHLPHLAKAADKLTVVRSMSHGEAAHERGVHNMYTGYRPSPAIQYPSMGSVVAHELGSRNNLPAYVFVPRANTPYAGSGYLSSAFGPFSLGSDPAGKDFQVRDLNLPGGVDATRFDRRRSMLETVDDHFKAVESSDAIDAMDAFYQRAYAMISSKDAREAFNLNAEPDAMRNRYGRHEAGQRLLLARRLAESGVRLVSVSIGGWDHHAGIHTGIERGLPSVDQAVAALINDLDERGRLDRTLVLLLTEFGRSPKINKDGGRDHWPKVFSIAMAGGGIRRGHIFGRSNATASEPEDQPLSVADFSATVYNQIGIQPDKELVSPGGRPIEIVKGGQVATDLLA